MRDKIEVSINESKEMKTLRKNSLCSYIVHEKENTEQNLL